MKWYKADRFNNQIQEIEVESETKEFVKIAGTNRRTAKTTEYDWIRESREEAKQCMVDYHERQVELAEGRLDYAKKNLENAKSA